MKIVLAHPGVGPFVQQTARALMEADLLASYWTMFADQPDARWRRALVQLASLVDVNVERELRRRAIEEVPPALLRLAPGWELVRVLLTKMKVDPRIVDAVWEHGVVKFDREVASKGSGQNRRDLWLRVQHPGKLSGGQTSWPSADLRGSRARA